MDWLVNLAGKAAGIGKVFDWLDGKKSYLAGAALILSGVAGELTAISQIHDAATALAFAKALIASADWQRILEGLSVMGLRHAVAKATDPAPAQ